MLWYLKIVTMLTGLVVGSIGADPCVALHPESVCDREKNECSNLLWLNKEMGHFMLDAESFVKFSTPVNCTDAAMLIATGNLIYPYAFNRDKYYGLRQAIVTAFREHIFGAVGMFPFVADEDLERSKEGLAVLLATLDLSDYETMMAKRAACNSQTWYEIQNMINFNSNGLLEMSLEKYWDANDLHLETLVLYNSAGCDSVDLDGRMTERFDIQELVGQLDHPGIAIGTAERIMEVRAEAATGSISDDTASFVTHLISVVSSDLFGKQKLRNANLALHIFQFHTQLCPYIIPIVEGLSHSASQQSRRNMNQFVKICAPRLPIHTVLEVSTLAAGKTYVRPGGLRLIQKPLMIHIMNSLLAVSQNTPAMELSEDRMKRYLQMNSLEGTGRQIGSAYMYGLRVKTASGPFFSALVRMFVDPTAVEILISRTWVKIEHIVAAKLMRNGIGSTIGPIALAAMTLEQLESVFTPLIRPSSTRN